MHKGIIIKGTIALFLAVFISFLIYTVYQLYLPRQVHYYLTASSDLEQERLGDITLLQSIKTISPPPIPTKDNDLFDYYTAGQNVTLATERGDDKVIRIQTFNSDPTMETAKGLRTGHTRDQVIAAYGHSFYTRVELGLSIIGYVDKTSHQTLEFWMSGNNVSMIRYDKAEME